MRCLLILLPILCTAAGGAWAEELNLIMNGGFERVEADGKPEDWVSAAGKSCSEECKSGKRAILLSTNQSTHQEIWWPEVGKEYAVSVWAKIGNVKPTEDRGYAFLALYQFDAAGDYLAYKDFAQITGSKEWARYTYTFKVAEGVEQISVRAGLYRASGKLWVDDVVLVKGRAAPEFAQVSEFVLPEKEVGKGRIAILRDDFPPLPGEEQGTATSPEAMRRLLSGAGYRVTMLSAEELSQFRSFNRTEFEAIILPYGPQFPLSAYRNFIRFLQQGGDFVSIGGYAFDRLLVKKDGKWEEYDRSVQARAREELVENGGFEGQVKGNWASHGQVRSAIVSDEPKSGKLCASCSAETIANGGWNASVPVKHGEEYAFSGWIRAEDVKPGELIGYAYLAVYQYDDKGNLVKPRDVIHLVGTNEWSRCEYSFKAERGATRADIKAGLFRASGKASFDDLSLKRLEPLIVMNTHFGNPRDGLETSPLQIGVFDPTYRFKRVVSFESAPGQVIVEANLKREGPLKGYASCGVLGTDERRWTSLLNAYDRYGRLRGSIGAIVRNYRGPFKRSTWVFFGVTNRDLFASEDKGMCRAFLQIVKGLLSETFLHTLKTNWASYSPGEDVEIDVTVSNWSWQKRQVEVAFELTPRLIGSYPELRMKPIGLKPAVISVAPGENKMVSGTYQLPAGSTGDFYNVAATLSEKERALDEMVSAFVVRSDKVIARGPRWRFSDNYLECGGKRHVLLGTDTYSSMFRSASENPFTWERCTQKCQDYGVSVFENLQVNGAVFPEPYVASEEFLRQVDGLVQLCQAHNLVYLPCLHCGHNTAIDDELLHAEARYSEEYAKRYRGIPGIAYYVNGDLKFRLDEMSNGQRMWNEFLKRKYGTDEKLRQAWYVNLPSEPLGQVPVPPLYAASWNDIRACDFHEFQLELIRRWTNAQHRACKGADPDHFTTVEYYKLPVGAIDLRRTMGELELGNIGYFGYRREDIAQFAAIFKFSDMRAVGKGLSVGEFGVKTHPAWSEEGGYTAKTYHAMRTEEEQKTLFLAIPHYTLGLGGCKMHNWCWRDADHRVFPWGLCYPCDNVEKDALNTYRNVGMLFRAFEMKYKVPEVCLLVPDRHQLGLGNNGSALAVQEGILRAIAALISLRTDFLVLNEADIAKLPPNVRCLFYPLPFCPGDGVFREVLRFAEKGGVLYVSGDISFDSVRKRTLTSRLETLAGVTFLNANYEGIREYEKAADRAAPTGVLADLPTYTAYPCIGFAADTHEIIFSGVRGPVAVLHENGAGEVFYTADIPELTQEDGSTVLRKLYASVLRRAGVQMMSLEPDDEAIHAFRLDTRDGGDVFVLFNPRERGSGRVGLPTKAGKVVLDVGPQRPGLAFVKGGNKLKALEATGRATWDGKVVSDANMHYALIAFDGVSLGRSVEMLLLPFGVGNVEVCFPQKEAEICVGEVRKGEWQTYERFGAKRDGGKIVIRIDEDRATCMVVIAEPKRRHEVSQKAAAMLTQP